MAAKRSGVRKRAAIYVIAHKIATQRSASNQTHHAYTLHVIDGRSTTQWDIHIRSLWLFFLLDRLKDDLIG